MLTATLNPLEKGRQKLARGYGLDRLGNKRPPGNAGEKAGGQVSTHPPGPYLCPCTRFFNEADTLFLFAEFLLYFHGASDGGVWRERSSENNFSSVAVARHDPHPTTYTGDLIFTLEKVILLSRILTPKQCGAAYTCNTIYLLFLMCNVAVI